MQRQILNDNYFDYTHRSVGGCCFFAGFLLELKTKGEWVYGFHGNFKTMGRGK